MKFTRHHRNSVGNIFWASGNWRRVSPRATARRKNTATGGLDFFHSSFRRWQWPAKQTSTHNKQLILIFVSFVFEICFGFSFLDLLLLQIVFSPGQFIRGSVFFSSASGARSGGAAKGSRLWSLLLSCLAGRVWWMALLRRCSWGRRRRCGRPLWSLRWRWVKEKQPPGPSWEGQRSSSTGKRKFRLRGEDLGDAGAAGWFGWRLGAGLRGEGRNSDLVLALKMSRKWGKMVMASGRGQGRSRKARVRFHAGEMKEAEKSKPGWGLPWLSDGGCPGEKMKSTGGAVYREAKFLWWVAVAALLTRRSQKFSFLSFLCCLP